MAATPDVAAYLPPDRCRAIAAGTTLPERTVGAALFADISGFTPLTEALSQALGPRRGVEAITARINQVYGALIAQVEAHGGSVIGFAGDAISCWFDEAGPWSETERAAACALALQRAMGALAADAPAAPLALKVAVASGPARRLVVGDPARQQFDLLAGATIVRLTAGEQRCAPGEVLVDEATAARLAPPFALGAWRDDPASGARFAPLGAAGDLPPIPPRPPEPLPALAPAQLRPWLPPAVYERVRAGLGGFLAELRPAAALFARFEGVDFDGEAAQPQLDALVRRAQAIIDGLEGTLLQLTVGDKGSFLYAVFGAPVAHEDDARRAVQAALQLHALAAELPFLAPLQIGVTAGTLLAGDYGAPSRHTYGAIGDEVNLAARLMIRASPGETLVSQRVQGLVAERFVLEPRPPVPLKGKAEPLPVFAVSGPARRRAVQLQEPEYALPMVGRNAELGVIDALLARAQGGQGQLIGLTGEPGLGKSRLAAEAIRLGRRRGFTCYGGACQAIGAATPYLIWGELFRALLDSDPDAPPRRRLRQLAGTLADLAPERAEAMPLLAPLLGFPIDENAFTGALGAETRRSALEALLLDCLAGAAREAAADGGALLLVLEDLHWLDPASHDLLVELARRAAALPVALLLVYRPMDTPRLTAPRVEALPQFTRIALAPLGSQALEQAVRAKLAQLYPERGGAVPPGLTTALAVRAEGNPFYVEELLNYLHDRGADPYDPAALASLELPSSLQSLVLSRIDQLTASQQGALKAASVVGRLFRASWLQGAFPELGRPAELRADLDELARLELTPIDLPEPELIYLFKHAITQEVSYGSLTTATQAALHERLAAFLERLGGDQEQLVDLLAFHYGRSQNLARRREYLRRAAVAASERYANATALDYLNEALALAPADDLDERYALLSERVKVLHRLGERAAWAADIASLDALVGQLGDDQRRLWLLRAQAHYSVSFGQLAETITLARRAAALAEQLGDHVAQADLLTTLSRVLIEQGSFAAATEAAEASLALARAHGLAREEQQALHALAILAHTQGRSEASLAYTDGALLLARQLGDRQIESALLNQAGIVADDRGDYTTAQARFEQAGRLARSLGMRHNEVGLLINAGLCASRQGDYAAARAHLEAATAQLRLMQYQRGLKVALINLGYVATNQGDAAAGLALCSEAAALTASLGDRPNLAYARWGMGNALLAGGDHSGAADAFDHALALAEELGMAALATESLAGLARVALARGDLAAATGRAERILAALQADGSLDGMEEALWVPQSCHAALAAAGDPRAAAVLELAHAALQARAARLPEGEPRRRFLEAVPWHRAIVAAWRAGGGEPRA